MNSSVRGGLLVGVLFGLMSSFSCGTPAKCTPSSCPAGCCDSSGTCQPGSSNNQCGTLGNTCASCALGQNCQFGTCATTSTGGGGGSNGGGTGGGTGGNMGGGNMGGGTGGGVTGGGGGGTGGGSALCGPQNCTGCCASNGSCVLTPNDAAACGLAGNACVSCAASGLTCDRGLCVGGSGGGVGGGTGGGGGACSPVNCTGCCRLGSCVTPPNNANNTTCGSAGNACQDCAAFGSTCNPFTFTCGGGAGGGVGGGGGGSCTGCTLPSGACVPSASTNVVNCGANGTSCVSCSPGELCLSGVCTVPPSNKRVGDACLFDSECQTTLGSAAICKQQTVSGNGTYSGGYCTLRCSGSTCPTGSVCVGLNPAYGEESLCWDSCTTVDRCRTTGYACYGLSSGSACWISPLPPLDAGTPADKVGNACTGDFQCINPPENGGVCLTNQLGFTWPQGYCSKQNCITNAECSSDGGALCIGFTQTDNACVRRCPDSRDAGQSTCRSGYSCQPYITALPHGGMATSTDGFCAP